MTRRSAHRLAWLPAIVAWAALGAPGPTDLGGLSQSGMRLAGTLAWAGDFDRDGFGDLVVGADAFDDPLEDEGAVFLFKATPQGFVFSRKLGVGVGGQAHLGASLAAGCDINGDGAPDVVAGAPGDAARAGAVHVFFGGVNASPGVVLPYAELGTSFGAAVACADVNGDTLDDVAVGAPDLLRSTPGVKAGGLFVFLGNTQGVFGPPLELRGGLTPERFGAAIASPGDVDGDGRAELVVGAPAFGVSNAIPGRVYLVRLRPGVTMLSTEGDYADTSLVDLAPAELGASVAALGDVNGDGVPDVAVGAPGAGASGISGSGAIVVLGVSGSGFSRVAQLNVAPGVQRMGRSLAAAGDLNGDGFADFLAGHGGYSDPVGQQRKQAGIAFLGGDEGVRLAPVFLSAPAGVAAQEFGWSGAGLGDLDGDGFADVAIGDPSAPVTPTPTGPTLDAGAFHLIAGGTRGPGTAFASRVVGQPAALGGVGDVNGDGLDDYAIGYPTADSSSGNVVVVLGGRGVFGNLNSLTLGAPVQGARFGASVAGAGDVNGDGFGDLIVGAPGLNDPAPGVGGAFVFFGQQGGLDASRAFPLLGADDNGYFGTSVASAGDFNGDGFDDVVVGAPGAPEGGVVYVYFGGPAGLAADRVLRVASPKAGAFFGASVASAGDSDLDGFADLVVGAPGVADAVLGRVFIVRGSPQGFAGFTELGGTSPDLHGLGRSVSGARDLNGDGWPDAIATASPPDVAGPVRAFAFLGGPGSPGAQLLMISLPTQPTSPVQSLAVSGLGDVDGDGLGDVLLGSGDLGIGGEVRLFLGDRNGALRPAPWRTQPMAVSERLGTALAGVGDLNDDGFADFATASQGITGVRLFAGGDLLPGRPYGLEQRFTDARKGRGYHARQGEPVTLGALLRDEVAALGPLQLEVEVKPVRLPFNGTNTVKSPPVRSGAAWVTFMPPAIDRYHWRARLVTAGVAGRWRVYGANDETGTDFSWGLAVVTRPDGGVDAGQSGQDGGVDAGVTADGGVDGGTGPMVFDAVGCNCAAFPAAPTAALLLALLVQRARRRRR